MQFSGMFNPTFLRSLKLCLLLLALLGIVMKGLIPAGFMPDVSRQAGSFIVICSGVEQKAIFVDNNGKPLPNEQHDTSAPCDFAVAPTAHATPVFLVEYFQGIVTANIEVPVFRQFAPRLFLPIPLPTGPPAAV